MIRRVQHKTIGINSPARPYSTNPVYHIPIRARCYDKDCKKIYKTLWQLFRHHNYNHKYESTYYIIELARQLVRESKKC